MRPPDPQTIVDVLLDQARRRPARAAFTLADVGGEGQPTLSFGELLSRGVEVATSLRALGLRRGDRVLICLPTGLEMVLSVYGVLLAGGVGVPVYPPAASPRIEWWKAQVTKVARVVQPIGAITSPRARLHLRSIMTRQGEGLFTVTPSTLTGRGGRPDEPVTVEPGDLALIQFTSGTTTTPRGAAITHASLMANIDALVSAMSLDEGDVSVSWLPPYHDMGLIGHLFTPVRCAAHQVLLSPQTFIRRPARWLEVISEVGATQTTAPNAAYEICARRVDGAERAGLDLGSLRWALNGAELVQAGTIERFCRAFEPCGFRREALRPVYGLAEATLAATLGPVDGPRVDWVDRGRLALDREAQRAPAGAEGSLAFVSVGLAIPGHELQIVDGEGRPLAERTVGEVRFRGPSVMRGYFNNPEATCEALDREGWLRTGDLGYLDDGALHVTGRLKELIVHRGRNFLPQDLELAATSVAGVRAGRAVACGAPSEELGTERILIFAEVHLTRPSRSSREAEADQLRRRIAEAVCETTGLRPDRVELLEPGTLPRTTSGKVRRAAVLAAFEAGLPLPGGRRPLSDALVPSLRSLAGLVEARVTRLLGWS